MYSIILTSWEYFCRKLLTEFHLVTIVCLIMALCVYWGCSACDRDLKFGHFLIDALSFLEEVIAFGKSLLEHKFTAESSDEVPTSDIWILQLYLVKSHLINFIATLRGLIRFDLAIWSHTWPRVSLQMSRLEWGVTR